MLKADDLLNAVDSFTGQVSFTLPLVNLPGRNGLDLILSASYSGPVWKSACTWNLDAPTGVLGLGWGLPLARIFAVFDKSAAPEAAAYFLAWRGGVRRLWCTGQSGNNWTYGTSGNDAWQITYNPSSQIWAIIDEDGVTHIFGDTGSGRNTVQNMVCWGNWLGSSDNLPQQQTIASGWLLNQSQNRFGDAIVYTYGTISVAVSGTQEHVQWTSLAGGVISNSLFATTAEGTPAEHETLLRLREASAGRGDRVAVINRGLAGVVLAFQSHFQRGAIASQADDSAEQRGAIQEGGAAEEVDLKF